MPEGAPWPYEYLFPNPDYEEVKEEYNLFPERQELSDIRSLIVSYIYTPAAGGKSYEKSEYLFRMLENYKHWTGPDAYDFAHKDEPNLSLISWNKKILQIGLDYVRNLDNYINKALLSAFVKGSNLQAVIPQVISIVYDFGVEFNREGNTITQAELEGMAEYTDRWGEYLVRNTKERASITKNAVEGYKAVSEMRDYLNIVISKLEGYYEAEIAELNERVELLNSVIVDLQDLVSKQQEQIAELRDKGWLSGMKFPDWPKDGWNPFEGADLSGIKTIAKYVAYGFGGLILLQALGFAKNVTKIFSR